MPTNLQNYLRFKANPELGMFRAVEEMEEKIMKMCEKMEEKMKKEMMAEIEKMVAKIEKQDPINAGFIEKIAKKTADRMIGDLIKETKGDQGEKGETGLQGEPGYTPKKGEDYFTNNEVEEIIVTAAGKAKPVKGVDYFDGKDGKDGKDSAIPGPQGPLGVPGKNGENGSPDTPEQIRDKLTRLTGDNRLDAKAIKGLEKLGERLGGTIHRGGMKLIYNEVPSGTVNGVNTAFTLANTPEPSSEMIYKNGIRQKRSGEDYTISVKTITFVTAPESGSLLLADYQKQ